MGLHKTSESKEVIAAITDIGNALGYYVHPEWPIPGTGPNPEQIDLAFLIAEDSKHPAFVVEIDSVDTPASMNNAIKIFGKPTQDWAKPYFVFHVFVSTSEKGSRRKNAESAFSTQNYRTFAFDVEKQSFLTHLIDHHRSIRSEVNIVELALAIDNAIWNSIDRFEVIRLANPSITLEQLSLISLNTNNFQNALSLSLVKQSVISLHPGEICYAGRFFVWPLMYGLKAYLNPADCEAIFADFRKWQTNPNEIIFHESCTFTGLSRDFDLAIVEIAPPIFCLVAMLFIYNRAAARLICEQLLARSIDGSLNSVWERYALLWCAIASIRVRCEDVADLAIDKINLLGGLPQNALTDMPVLALQDDSTEGWFGLLSTSEALPFSMAALKRGLSDVKKAVDLPALLIALFLVDEDMMFTINRRILSLG